MNNTQLYLTIGILTVTVILAWLSNRADHHRLNDKVDRSAESLRVEMAGLRVEMVSLCNDHHKNNLAMMGYMMGYMIPLHERMAKLKTHE